MQNVSKLSSNQGWSSDSCSGASVHVAGGRRERSHCGSREECRHSQRAGRACSFGTGGLRGFKKHGCLHPIEFLSSVSTQIWRQPQIVGKWWVLARNLDGFWGRPEALEVLWCLVVSDASVHSWMCSASCYQLPPVFCAKTSLVERRSVGHAVPPLWYPLLLVIHLPNNPEVSVPDSFVNLLAW